jgi:hypothetical protein
MQLKTTIEIESGTACLDDCQIDRLLDRIENYLNNHLELNGVYLDSVGCHLDEIEVWFSVPLDMSNSDLKSILLAVDGGIVAIHELDYGLYFSKDIRYEYIEAE